MWNGCTGYCKTQAKRLSHSYKGHGNVYKTCIKIYERTKRSAKSKIDYAKNAIPKDDIRNVGEAGLQAVLVFGAAIGLVAAGDKSISPIISAMK